jgi:hypothetical protein
VAEPAAATSGEYEWSLAGGGGKGTARDGWLGAFDGQWLHHASDFWAFGGAVRGRVGPSQQAALATVDARFTLDALQWIPSLALGAGGGWHHGGSAAWTLESRVEASLAYRASRHHGWVVRGAWEQLWPAASASAGGSRWLLSLGWVGYGGRGIGLDL